MNVAATIQRKEPAPKPQPFLDRLRGKMPRSRPPFVTGSHAYGTPHAESDVDLVVLMELDDANKIDHLWKEAKIQSQHLQTNQYGGLKNEFVTLRYGKLNLLCCLSTEWYDAWLEGTRTLLAESPVTRERAVEVFSGLFNKYRLQEKGE